MRVKLGVVPILGTINICAKGINLCHQSHQSLRFIWILGKIEGVPLGVGLNINRISVLNLNTHLTNYPLQCI